MPEEVVGSRAGDDAGLTYQREPGPDPYSEEGFAKFKGTLGEIGQDKALEPIKDFQGAVKSLVEAQKMIGGSLRLPGKDLSDEEREKALGELKGKLKEAGILEATPETPDAYKIDMPQIEGWEINKNLYDSFRGAAHSSALTPKQAQGLFDWYVNFQAEANAQEEKAFDEMKTKLKTEWGGLYARKMESARRAAAKFLGQDGDDIISQLPPSLGARFVRAFATIGEPLLEEDIVMGEGKGFPSLEEVNKKIAEMWQDPKGPLSDEGHADHKRAVEEHTKLQRMKAQMEADRATR